MAQKKLSWTERKKALEENDLRHLWHPFTQMKDWEKDLPLIIAEGKGSRLKDLSGRWFLDGVSSLWVNIHGHRHKTIDRAVMSQVKKVSHTTLLGLSNVPAIMLARRLVEMAPTGLTRVFYSDDGSTAVEIALKMAFQYWQQKSPEGKGKTRFVSFTNGYHGDTIGAVSVGGIDLFHGVYRPLLFPSFKVESPYCYRCPIGLTYPSCRIACLDPLEDLLKKRHQEIAALVIEPLVQAAGGFIMAPPGHLTRVRDLCSHYNILMIADEVATGCGRTGRMFACEHEGVAPDILCVAKGLTGGYLPLAATLTTEEIYNGFRGEYEEFKTFFHGHSYTGNPLGCAAALASLAVFEKEKTLKKLQPKSALLSRELRSLSGLSHVGDIRQKGFMVGIELVADKKTRRPYPLMERRGMKVALAARKLGLLLRPLGNIIVLMPPLSTTSQELRQMVRIIKNAIISVTEG